MGKIHQKTEDCRRIRPDGSIAGRSRKCKKRRQKNILFWLCMAMIFMLGGICCVKYLELYGKEMPKETEIITESYEEMSSAGSEEKKAVETEVPEESTVLPEETEAEQKPVTLLFGGDVLLSDHVLNAYQKERGINGVVGENYLSLIQEADRFIVNEEFPFSERGVPEEDKQYTFRLHPDKVSLLQEMGIDWVTLANNHSLDFGTDALLDTVEVLDQAGIAHTGAGADLTEAKKAIIQEVNGWEIGMIGASRVVPYTSWGASSTRAGMLLAYEPEQLLEEIRQLRDQVDYLIVYLHWGVEREEQPKAYQRELGRACIDAGADLVIGSHPHVLQGIEYYQGKPIVYSLGNFVFGSSIPKTMLLQIKLESESCVLRLFPGTSSAGYTRMISEEEKEAFYQYLIEISSFDGKTAIEIDADGVVYPSDESESTESG